MGDATGDDPGYQKPRDDEEHVDAVIAGIVGAGQLLGRFRGIQLELPLRRLCADQDKWIPMIEWMAQRGFGVAMAKENRFDWQAMRLLELDMLFMREARD